MRIARIAAAFVVVISIAMPALAANRVATELIANQSRIADGEEFRVGVRFRMPEHSHIYWSNPGESGLPTDIEWDLPEGFTADALQWPAPSAFYDDFLKETSFGYEGDVLLFATVTAPANLKANDSITLRAKATWLVCLEDGLCIPEDAALELVLTAGSEPSASDDAAAFAAAAERIPRPAAENDSVLVAVEPGPDAVVRVHIDPPWRFGEKDDAVQLFPYKGKPWKTSDSSASTRVFQPPKPVDGPVSGVIACEAVNKETGARRSVYIRFGETR